MQPYFHNLKLLILCLCCTGITTMGWGQSHLWEKAQKSESAYDYPKAIALYTRLAENGSVPAMERLSALHYQFRNYSSAKQWMDQAVAADSLQDESILLYGLIWLSQGQPGSATYWFREYERRVPADSRGQAFADFSVKIPSLPIDTTTYEVSRLPFNTAYSELAAAPDNEGLIFASDRPNATAGVTFVSSVSGGPLSDLYFVRSRDSGQWSSPTPLPGAINTRFHEGSPAISPDGQTLYFTRSQIPDADTPGNILMQATKDKSGWSDPSPVLPKSWIYDHGYPSVSPDGKTLYFSAKTPTGYGGWDLYTFALDETGAPAPQNMGSNINSPGNELYPFAHKNGTFYFASDGHAGFGGLDIFSTRPLNEDWKQPNNLGLPLNSVFDDFGLNLDSVGTSGYLSSNRKSKGRDDDLYSVEIHDRPFIECKPQEKLVLCYKVHEESTIDELPYQLIYEWDMGDGTKMEGLSARHCYTGPGTYEVSLRVIDSLSGEPMFVQSSYTLELAQPTQPVINGPEVAVVSTPVKLDAKDCHLPGIEIQSYHWFFGDQQRSRGLTADHVYGAAGTYQIRLGVEGIDQQTGEPTRHCVEKTISIELKPDETQPSLVIDANSGKLDTVYSTSGITDLEYRLQLGTSLLSIGTQPANFKGLSPVREYQDGDLFRYFYGSASQPDSLLGLALRVRELGFKYPAVMAFSGDSLLGIPFFRNNWLPGDDLSHIVVKGKLMFDPVYPPTGSSLIIWEDLITGDTILRSPVSFPEGTFLSNLPKGYFYGYYPVSDGLYPTSKHLDLREFAGEAVIEDTMQSVTIKELILGGRSIVLNNVFFDTDKADLKEESYQELYRVLAVLLENKSYIIEISGHTDNVGSDAFNLDLSKRRAMAVAQFLAINGIAAEDITSVGYGETVPVANNESAAGRKLNRRVEFRVSMKKNP